MHLFTSESVSRGHPDKICDQISDLVVDMFLKHDPQARLAIETTATTNRIMLLGEVRSTYQINEMLLDDEIRALIRDIGYEQDGFHHETLSISDYLHGQSADIAQGVDALGTKEEGAGDQGIMFGFACSETKHFMPAPLYYAHKILKALDKARRSEYLDVFGPDAKSQVTLTYEGTKPLGVHTIVLSTQHTAHTSLETVKALVRPIIEKAFPEGWITHETIFHINATGRFVIGGPDGDSGLTGRKIIVDTYGGAAPHGGGAFSGKDPTKVDRSAAYMARYLAKNIVAAGLCERITLQLAYCIGIAKPLSLYVNLKEAEISLETLKTYIWDTFDLSPKGIRTLLKLNQPIYLETASFGHFGRTGSDTSFPWEKLDAVEGFKALL